MKCPVLFSLKNNKIILRTPAMNLLSALRVIILKFITCFAKSFCTKTYIGTYKHSLRTSFNQPILHRINSPTLYIGRVQFQSKYVRLCGLDPRETIAKLFKNCVDPDQTPRSVESNLGLHCLSITPFQGLQTKMGYSMNIDSILGPSLLTSGPASLTVHKFKLS